VKAVFLDRDGVICHNRDDHIKSWDEFQFIDGAKEAIARLTKAGLPVVVVTNQAAINRGLTSASLVDDIHRRMIAEVASCGGRIVRVYYCPHRPDEHCGCRKPQPGMLLQAADELGIELQESYLIGDAISDVQAAQSVGVKAYMVLTGRGKDQYVASLCQGRSGFRHSPDLRKAVDDILRVEFL
jgi:histidinol-phosphate phosphatase family protein